MLIITLKLHKIKGKLCLYDFLCCLFEINCILKNINIPVIDRFDRDRDAISNYACACCVSSDFST